MTYGDDQVSDKDGGDGEARVQSSGDGRRCDLVLRDSKGLGDPVSPTRRSSVAQRRQKAVRSRLRRNEEDSTIARTSSETNPKIEVLHPRDSEQAAEEKEDTVLWIVRVQF